MPHCANSNGRQGGCTKKLSQVARLWAGGQLQETPEHDPDPDNPPPLDQAAAAFGLQVVESEPAADQAPPTCWLWPENLPIWLAWLRLQTQWQRAGMDGERTGLDYAACTAWLQAQGWAHRRTRSLRHALDCLAGMERAALDVWHQRRERERRQKPLNPTR